MTFDIRRSLRRIRPERFTAPLSRRPREFLPFVPPTPEAGLPLLLDTCVYIDLLQGRTSATFDALLQVRTLNHLSVCVAELAHGFGRLDPSHTGQAVEPQSLHHAGLVCSGPVLVHFDLALRARSRQRYPDDAVYHALYEVVRRIINITSGSVNVPIPESGMSNGAGDSVEFGDACAFLCSAKISFIVEQNLLLDRGRIICPAL